METYTVVKHTKQLRNCLQCTIGLKQSFLINFDKVSEINSIFAENK